MESFVIVREKLAYLGFTNVNPSIGQCILRAVNILLLVFATITAAWYLLFEASVFEEWTKSIASLIMFIYNDTIYLVLLWNWGRFAEHLQYIQSKAQIRATQINVFLKTPLHCKLFLSFSFFFFH